MKTPTVVEDFNVFEDAGPCFLTSFISLKVREFGLECVKEAFRDRIVVAVALAAHALLDRVALDQDSDFLTGVLTATIRVQD